MSLSAIQSICMDINRKKKGPFQMDLDHLYKLLSDGATCFEELRGISPSFMMQVPQLVFKRF
mgnify:CR=1 FL=1